MCNSLMIIPEFVIQWWSNMLQCGSRISIRLLQMQTKAICCNLYTSYIEGTVSRRGYKNMGMRTRVEPTVSPTLDSPLLTHFYTSHRTPIIRIST